MPSCAQFCPALLPHSQLCPRHRLFAAEGDCAGLRKKGGEGEEEECGEGRGRREGREREEGKRRKGKGRGSGGKEGKTEGRRQRDTMSHTVL